MPATLRQLLDTCGEDLRGLRDRALLLLGFSGALRRSELVGVDAEHVTEAKDGLLLFLPWSKGDQAREGETLGIPRGKRGSCPVEALAAWRRAADIEDGPLFLQINRWGSLESNRLSAQSVNLIIKRRALLAGLDPSSIGAFSSYSLRAGFVTAAYDRDVPEQATQKHARHKKPETTRTYNRVVSAFKGNPAKGLLDADG